MSTTEILERIIATTRIVNGNETQTWLGTASSPFQTYCKVPVDDAQLMLDFYQTLPDRQKIPELSAIPSAMDLVSKVGSKIFEEWCLEQEDKLKLTPYKWNAGAKYSAQGNPGFTDFVTRETHLELDQRSGRGGMVFEWNPEKRYFQKMVKSKDHPGRYEAQPMSDEEYREQRTTVVNAIVLRAIEYHNAFGDIFIPRKGTTENLRTDLQKHVQNAEMLEFLRKNP